MGAGFAFDQAMSALGRGAHDFLTEPVDPVELVARVKSAVQMTGLRGELLEQSRRLEMLVYQDALTGLYNRRFMLAQLGALTSGARRHGRRSPRS
jgi:two-component system cell cycle response regulator